MVRGELTVAKYVHWKPIVLPRMALLSAFCMYGPHYNCIDVAHNRWKVNWFCEVQDMVCLKDTTELFLLLFFASGEARVDPMLTCFLTYNDPQIRLWCNTCWLHGGQHGNQAFLIHVLADHVSTSIGGGSNLRPQHRAANHTTTPARSELTWSRINGFDSHADSVDAFRSQDANSLGEVTSALFSHS